LAATGAYIVLMVVADGVASRRTAAEARAAGVDVQDVMVAPVPANPFAGDVVVATGDAYHLGQFRWLRRPHVEWHGSPLPAGERDETVLATLRLPAVRNFLRWSRYPFVAVQETDDGYLVRFGDARYPGQMRGGLGGITVRVDRH
ncbi:MAG TPA: hypothetical protein VK929_01815, partial [Longimicrobiales bacterium]|nr:hypothetical protein [Longimicrobiales bacterium]